MAWGRYWINKIKNNLIIQHMHNEIQISEIWKSSLLIQDIFYFIFRSIIQYNFTNERKLLVNGMRSRLLIGYIECPKNEVFH